MKWINTSKMITHDLCFKRLMLDIMWNIFELDIVLYYSWNKRIYYKILFPLIFSEYENLSIVKVLLRRLLLLLLFKRSGMIIKYLLKISYTVRVTNLYARSL